MNPFRYIVYSRLLYNVHDVVTPFCSRCRDPRHLAANANIILSPVVFYEIKRGLLKKDARKQLGFFDQLVTT